MNLFSNIRWAGRYFLPALAAFVFLTACSDDDEMQTPLGTPNVTNSAQTVSSLTFVWDAVPNVSSYSCELSDPDGTQVAGLVTTSTTARFTDLTPNTTYTLNVYAYAAVGSPNTTSKAATLTATTAAVVPLQMSKPEVEILGTTATLTWESVEYAATYEYSYMQGNEEVAGSTSEPSLTLRNMPAGDYRVGIFAVPAEDDEAHSTSPVVAVTFSVVKEKSALWSRTGIYHSVELADEWEAELTAYDDGTYTLARWHGVEGYNLEFTVEGTEVVIQNHYTESNGYYYVYTGRSDVSVVGIYPAGGYSDFSGGKDGGDLWFYAYGTGSGGYDYFTWQGSETGGVTVADLVGTYTEHTTGTDWTLNDYAGGEVDKSGNVVTFTKVDDQTISITNLYGSGSTLEATVDLENKTLTFRNNQYIVMPEDGYSYTFGSAAGVDVPLVATFGDDFTVNLSGWAAWAYFSGDGWYSYMDNAFTTLVKN